MRLPTRLACAVFSLFCLATVAEAGGPFRRATPRARTLAPVAAVRPENRAAPTGMLGSFVPANYIYVRGNGIVGGGYSPLSSYGQNSMDLYGPFAALRQTSAPVVQYSRGYDGSVVRLDGTSFSNPFLPDQSPVLYPTRASNYGALRGPGIPTRTGSGINWVDQN